jgi:hypothetical protein
MHLSSFPTRLGWFAMTVVLRIHNLRNDVGDWEERSWKLVPDQVIELHSSARTVIGF